MSRYRIIGFAELESTNRHASAHLENLTCGDVVQADVQSAGHGRMRRRWVSHVPGNLCMSIVLKPRHAAPADLPLSNLSQLLALSVCHALDARGVRATLKWPNDVLVGGKKIAGLLAETVVRGAGEFAGLVLGLGVNLNLGEDLLATIDQPATSLSSWTDGLVDVAGFRDAVLVDFFNRCDVFLNRGFSMIHSEYVERCAFLGTNVEVLRGSEIIRGRAHGLSPAGELEIMTRDGAIRLVDLGEMFQAV